ncbi:MAG: hypothetical protein Q9175_005672 [Cornicularia normoerica]
MFSFSIAIITASLYIKLSSRPFPPARISDIDENTKRQFSNRSMENTLFFVPVNSGMLHWADNLLCALRHVQFDTTKMIFWALDQPAQVVLQNEGYATYHDPSFFSVSGNENYRGDTKAYKRMMLERPKFFIDILATGYDILFVDADTIFFQSPLLIRDMGADGVFSTDQREFYQTHDAFRDVWRRGSKMPPICNGIFWMKSSPATIKLWHDMLDNFDSHAWWTAVWRLMYFQDDQRGMDMLLNDGRAKLVEPFPSGIKPDMLLDRYSQKAELSIRLLDQTAVVNGHLLKNRRSEYELNLVELRRTGKDRMAVHLNWDTKQMTKEQGAKQLGFWLLDEKGNCNLEKV